MDFTPDFIRGLGYSSFLYYKKEFEAYYQRLAFVFDHAKSHHGYRKRTKAEIAVLPGCEQNRIKEAAEVAKVFKEVAKEWSALKKKCVGNLSSDENLKDYISYFAPEVPAAVVKNTWETYMGRIGSTHATITVGKGKEKPFSRYSTPSWEPIGYVVWYEHCPSWMGGSVKCERVIRSWDDVADALSSYENQYIELYKHPRA